VVTAAIQLTLAAIVRLSVPPGRAAAAMMAAILVLAAFTAALAALRRRDWTVARLSETDELLEAVAGQRTRLVQGDEQDEAQQDVVRRATSSCPGRRICPWPSSQAYCRAPP